MKLFKLILFPLMTKHITLLIQLSLVMVLVIAQGCTPALVPIPPAAEDKPPIITIHALASGSSGRIESQGQELSTPRCAPNQPCRVHATIGTDVLITVDATNPGGVQSLTVELKDTATYPFPTLVTVTTTGTRNQDKGPEFLQIIGHNGAGGIGSNPLTFHVTPQTGIEVIATATNFNGMVSKGSVVYYPLLPVVAGIDATPNTINKGEQTIVQWNTESASTINVEPLGITGSGIDAWGGSSTISPQQTTTYTLTATNFIYDECTFANKMNCQGAEKVIKNVKVTVNKPPQPPQPQTMRIDLQAQPMGQGGYQPFVYTFAGTVILQQIELPTDAGNSWVAAIQLPKLGNTTDDCGDSTKYVLLLSGSHTTPQQMMAIYGSEMPTLSSGGRIVACVSPKPGAAIGSSVGILITYSH